MTQAEIKELKFLLFGKLKAVADSIIAYEETLNKAKAENEYYDNSEIVHIDNNIYLKNSKNESNKRKYFVPLYSLGLQYLLDISKTELRQRVQELQAISDEQFYDEAFSQFEVQYASRIRGVGYNGYIILTLKEAPKEKNKYNRIPKELENKECSIKLTFKELDYIRRNITNRALKKLLKQQMFENINDIIQKTTC